MAVEQLAAMALVFSRTEAVISTAIGGDPAGGGRVCHTDITRLRMRRLTRDAIERYVAADNPIDCAGSYKLESRGIVLFDRIESDDQSAITGLPLIALVNILRDMGFAIP